VASLVSGYVRRDFVARETRLAAEPDVFWGTLQDRDEPAVPTGSATSFPPAPF
jgi:hypothetical protein